MDTQMRYIQTGWTVRSRDGRDLGTVVSLSHDTFIISDDDQQRAVPKSVIDEEDEGAKLAILSIDADALESPYLG